MSFSELANYLRLGGVTTAVILFASVLALGVAIERVIALWGVRSATRALGELIAKHLLRQDVAAAKSAADRSNALSADLFRAGFERASKTVGASLDAAVDRERQQLSMRMKRGLWLLGTIGATAPFVGLFGTVAGIMRSFHDLGLDSGQNTGGGPAAVMTGISEALVTTAVGILVAVEAVVLYNIFQARLSRVNVETKLIAEEFVELLRDVAPTGRLPTSTPPSAPSPASSESVAGSA